MPKELIHVYQKFGVTFEFYVDEEGTLCAQMVVDDKTYAIPCIDGLPEILQQGLLDPARRAALKKILENSFFTKVGEILSINVKVRGGWNDEVHKGYSDFGGQITAGTCLTSDAGYIEGTYCWAKDLNFSDADAKEIADACVETDSIFSGLSPVPWLGDPSVHFNIHSPPIGDSIDGDANDSRIQYAVLRLADAIQMYRNSNRTWITHLGHGLHALQDSFAHTEHFVTTYVPKKGYPIKVHVGTGGAIVGFFDTVAGTGFHDFSLPDNIRSEATKKGNGTDDVFYRDEDHPDVPSKDSPGTFVNSDTRAISKPYRFSQRYSDTKTATYLYLILFLRATQMDIIEHFRERVKNITRRMLELRTTRIKGQNLNKFLGLFEAVHNRIIGSSSSPLARELGYIVSPVLTIINEAKTEIQTAGKKLLTAEAIVHTQERHLQSAKSRVANINRHLENLGKDDCGRLTITVEKIIAEKKYYHVVSVTFRNVLLATGNSKTRKLGEHATSIDYLPIRLRRFLSLAIGSVATPNGSFGHILQHQVDVRSSQEAIRVLNDIAARFGDLHKGDPVPRASPGVLRNTIVPACNELQHQLEQEAEPLRQTKQKAQRAVAVLETALCEAQGRMEECINAADRIKENAVHEALNAERESLSRAGQDHPPACNIM